MCSQDNKRKPSAKSLVTASIPRKHNAERTSKGTKPILRYNLTTAKSHAAAGCHMTRHKGKFRAKLTHLAGSPSSLEWTAPPPLSSTGADGAVRFVDLPLPPRGPDGVRRRRREGFPLCFCSVGRGRLIDPLAAGQGHRGETAGLLCHLLVHRVSNFMQSEQREMLMVNYCGFTRWEWIWQQEHFEIE